MSLANLTRAGWHSWPAFLARYYTRETWASLPGPWPVKLAAGVALAAAVAACQLCPGQIDDLLLVAALRWLRARQARTAGAR